MSNEDLQPCMTCGTPTPVDELDGKPGPGRWTATQLRLAADAGKNFEYLECGKCYGPGYIAPLKK